MAEISKSDYESLLAFRSALRKFLHFAEQGARRLGLTPQQHQLLLAIKGQSGREWATISELAEALQLRHHTVVSLVDRCQLAGHVSREHDPIDRRSVRVSLTARGAEVLQQLSEANLKELETLKRMLRSAGI